MNEIISIHLHTVLKKNIKHLHTPSQSFCMEWNGASCVDTDQETIALGSDRVLSHISDAARESPAADGDESEILPYVLVRVSIRIHHLSWSQQTPHTHNTNFLLWSHTHIHSHQLWQEVKQEVRVSFRDHLSSVSVQWLQTHVYMRLLKDTSHKQHKTESASHTIIKVPCTVRHQDVKKQ